jgi:2-polyprenyl-3-methyl-5-hydroxy-6-metoxy-1,4-benzoquinol methylase
MATAAWTSYDEVPYDSNPFAQTHPEHLATVATLVGMTPPPVDGCRVLELGCAAGGNLIPMAVAMPDSSFVGIDLSARQIASGRETVRALRLRNIDLRHLSILDVGEDFGEFDYLICHGVYSWVAAEVQDKILEVCARHLSPDGVAFVSYNIHPGWRLRGLVRDLVCYYTRGEVSAAGRIGRARRVLEVLSASLTSGTHGYRRLLKEEVDMARRGTDSYLFHEYLEECNSPVYFHEFAERALGKGLHYVGDADVKRMALGPSTPGDEGPLHELEVDHIGREQSIDLLRNLAFRQSLLCRRPPPAPSGPRAERLVRLRVGSRAQARRDVPDLRSETPEEFAVGDGPALPFRVPLLKAAMLHLTEIWPRTEPFARLRGQAYARLRLPEPDDAGTATLDTCRLAEGLLGGYLAPARGLVEFCLNPPRFGTEVGARPVVSPLARLQALTRDVVTNLRHEQVALRKGDRELLPLLDGSRDLAEATRLYRLTDVPMTPAARARAGGGFPGPALTRLVARALLLPHRGARRP